MQQQINDPHRRLLGGPFDIKRCYGAPKPLPTPSARDAPGVDGCSAEFPIKRMCERGPHNSTMPGRTVRVDVKSSTAAGGHFFPKGGVYYLADVTKEDLRSLQSKLVDRKVWQWIVEVCEPMYWARAEAWLFSANGGAGEDGYPKAETYSMAQCPDSIWRVAHDLKPDPHRENASAFKGTGTIWSIDEIANTEQTPVNLETTALRGAQSQADILAAMIEQNKSNRELIAALLADRSGKAAR